MACLHSHRWVKRVLAWTPPGSRNAGRPANCWEEKLVTYCRYKNFGNWVDAAEDRQGCVLEIWKYTVEYDKDVF